MDYQKGDRLLLWDDDNAFRARLAEELTARGFEVKQAATADSFSEEFLAGNWDLVVLDIYEHLGSADVNDLGRRTGLSLAESVRRASSAMPIFLVTSHESTITVADLRLSGPTFIEPKGEFSPWLAEKIRERFDGLLEIARMELRIGELESSLSGTQRRKLLWSLGLSFVTLTLFGYGFNRPSGFDNISAWIFPFALAFAGGAGASILCLLVPRSNRPFLVTTLAGALVGFVLTALQMLPTLLDPTVSVKISQVTFCYGILLSFLFGVALEDGLRRLARQGIEEPTPR